MKKMYDESVSIAEKIALFHCNIWPKMSIQNDSFAQKQRIVGNEYFASQQFEMAIEAYNECVCYTTSLEFRGIAFANRAAAYLKLRSYQDCLDSIRLAKECPLPAKVMTKVLAREKLAVESLELDEVAVNGSSLMPIELSYRRNKRIPSFVFCLKLKENGNPYGGIITTKDLHPGDVLAIEQPLTTYTRSISMCHNCLQNCGSLQPCICGVMFCSPECKKEAFDTYHNFECSLVEHLVTFSDEDCMVLRVFFKLVQRFEDFTSFREYLENIKAPNPFEGDDYNAWPDAGVFESQYRLYYATERPSMENCVVRKQYLFRNEGTYKSLHICMAKAAIIIDILKRSKQIPCVATGADDWAFLSEHFFRLFFYKTFTAKAVAVASSQIEYVQYNRSIMMGLESEVNDALALYGTASLFRTSCVANIDMEYAKKTLIVRAKKCISRGTELLACCL